MLAGTCQYSLFGYRAVDKGGMQFPSGSGQINARANANFEIDERDEAAPGASGVVGAGTALGAHHHSHSRLVLHEGGRPVQELDIDVVDVEVGYHLTPGGRASR